MGHPLRPEQIAILPQGKILRLEDDLIKRATTTVAEYSIFVDNSFGDDNNCGSELEPKKTIQAAINDLPVVINHNIVIFIANGLYEETLNFTGHVVGPSGFITLSGDLYTDIYEDDLKVVLYGKNEGISTGINVDCIQGILFKGILVYGYKDFAINSTNYSKILLDSCQIKNNKVGVNLQEHSSTYYIKNSIISNNVDGFIVYKNSTADFENCVFKDNKNSGILVNYCSNISLYDCKIFSNVNGIFVANHSRSEIFGSYFGSSNEGNVVGLNVERSSSFLVDATDSDGTVFVDNDIAIYISWNSTGLILNSYISDSKSHGILADTMSSVEISNSTILNNATFGGSQVTSNRKSLVVFNEENLSTIGVDKVNTFSVENVRDTKKSFGVLVKNGGEVLGNKHQNYIGYDDNASFFDDGYIQ